ncbi:MAG: DUF3667 domain-containing protein [Bacteroidales bacterium]|nr:DUF3667 domain-containing protein [Bacteroidales bacterium]
MKLFQRREACRRLFRIYLELGYIPWRKPKKARKKRGGVYMGTREAIIPFLNKDAKRTIADLVFRPGYMMRDYIQRGRHEQYLAPFTALLVFYSVFTLLTAVVQPGASRSTFGESLLEATEEAKVEVQSDLELGDRSITKEKAEHFFTRLFRTVSQAILITHLDLYPEAVDTSWKESLAAVEADLRGKGIPLFLGDFLMLWLAMALLLKKYKVSVSGAAAASAYVLCQFCIFMFLALLVTFGKSSELGFLIMGILLFIDYRQWLQVGNRKALGLTLKTGVFYLGVTILFYVLLGMGLVILSLYRP